MMKERASEFMGQDILTILTIGFQGFQVSLKNNAIGCDPNLLDARNTAEVSSQLNQVTAQGWLAASQTEFIDAGTGKQTYLQQQNDPWYCLTYL